MVRNILPLLEDWSGIVRRKTLDMLADFAQHGILAPDKIVPLTLSESDADTTTRVDDEIVSRIISTLSEGDADTTTRVLKILSIMAKQGVTPVNPPEISLVKNSLSHRNWRVRVAGLRLLESLADDTQYKKISFPAQETIVRYLSDNVEEVQLAGLRTLFTFIDNGIFRDRVTVPNTVSDVISSLLKSDSEDVRISAIQIISTYIAKAEFDSVIDGVLPDLIKLMNPENQDSHAMILRTVCSLADTGKFFVNQVFAEGIRRILPSSLSANWNAEVRMAALQIVPVVSKHDEFDQIVAESLEALLKVTLRKDDVAGNVDEVDEAFRIEVLKTLADLAKNDTFRGRIDARLSRSYALTAKAGSWPTRVAFLKLMSVLGPSARDALKSAVKQMMPDINDTLHDNENSEVRMAGVQLLSISVVKEISSSEFNTLVPTLVTLLSDSEEEVRITALQTLSDLAKQDVFRKVINETLPALFESVKRNEPKTRIGALDTCVSLAQDVAFCDIVSHAAPQIIAWVRDDPDYDVRIAAMGTLSHLSRNEAFRLIVPEAAPHVISHLENGAWSIRLQVLRTLSTFAENDAFRDIMKNSFPRIVQCMRDEDDDVRVEVLTMLLNLLQQNLYQTSIRNALQSSGLKPLIDSMSDHLTRVRLAALPLIPKVIELDAFRDPSSARLVISTIGNLLSDHDDELCLVALEALRALVEQDVAYAQQLTPLIPRLLQFLKPDHSNSGIPTTVLLTLSTTVALDEGSVDKVVEGIRTLFSDFKDSPESQFWDAATRVFSALASRGVQETVSSYVTSALGHSNWRTQISGMSVLELIEQENFGFQFDGFRPLVIKLVESSDLDVSLAAIRIAGNSLNMLPDFLTYHKVDAAIQKTMREVLGNIKSTDPSKALEQLTQFVHDSKRNVHYGQQFGLIS
ncbi:armadillo-type protein [Mycena sanguinolenta]|nr:armadillo-type protein [Mycena sanguinolenta]